MPLFAANYLLDQADIGMACALGTGGGMVKSLVAAHAPADVRAHVLAKFESGEWAGRDRSDADRTHRRLGPRRAGDHRDQQGDGWLLNGVKWFASNCDGEAFVVMAKPEGAPDSAAASPTSWCSAPGATARATACRSVDSRTSSAPARSPRARWSSSTPKRSCWPATSAGVRALRRQGPEPDDGVDELRPAGHRLVRAWATRAVPWSSRCVTRGRAAFGGALIDKPLMRRKLAELIVDVEAAQALVFDGTGSATSTAPSIRQRIAVPGHQTQGRAGSASPRRRMPSRSTAATATSRPGRWPGCCATAQVNTIWEGPDNILCLDVRRGIERRGARTAVGPDAGRGLGVRRRMRRDRRIGRRRDRGPRCGDRGVAQTGRLDGSVAEARLYPLAQFIGDVYAGALLTEQAAWERESGRGERKALVARLYAQRYLADHGPLRGIDADSEEALERFDELADGALQL